MSAGRSGTALLNGRVVGDREQLPSDGLAADFGAAKAGRNALDNAPFPDRLDVEPAAQCEAVRPDPGTFAHQLERVLPHQDAEIAFGFDDQPVGIDAGETGSGQVGALAAAVVVVVAAAVLRLVVD